MGGENIIDWENMLIYLLELRRCKKISFGERPGGRLSGISWPAYFSEKPYQMSALLSIRALVFFETISRLRTSLGSRQLQHKYVRTSDSSRMSSIDLGPVVVVVIVITPPFKERFV